MSSRTMQAEPKAAPEPQPQAEPEPEPEPEGEPDEAAEAEPEPEPIPAVKPSVTASFEIRAAHGGKPVAADAAGAALEGDFRTYWAVVSDSIPRRLQLWELGQGSEAADTRVSTAALSGCSARLCDGDSHPPGSVVLEHNVVDDETAATARLCYYFLPVAHQSAADLIKFFTKCGESATQLPRTSSGGELVRRLEAPAAALAAVKKAEVFGVEAQPGDGGAAAQAKPTMLYQLRCTPLPPRNAPPAGSEGPPELRPWELAKRFADFESLRQQLIAADRESTAESLELAQVPFPPRLSLWASEGPAEAAERRVPLQTWVNQIIFLNNTLVASGHLELDSILTRFFHPIVADSDEGWRAAAEAAGYAEPQPAERDGSGELLVGRRLWVGGVGRCEVVAFHPATWGASTHSLRLEDGRVEKLKLARKTNTDPEKLAWLIQPVATAEEGVPPSAEPSLWQMGMERLGLAAAGDAAGGEPSVKTETEEAAHAAGVADQAMPEGTRICVAGRGRGSYVRFEKRGLGFSLLVANEHVIAFDSGETAVVKLTEVDWTVSAAEMGGLSSFGHPLGREGSIEGREAEAEPEAAPGAPAKAEPEPEKRSEEEGPEEQEPETEPEPEPAEKS